MDPKQLEESTAAASSAASESAPDVREQSPAEPSPAKDEERKTLLDAVKNVLDADSIEDDEGPIEEPEAATAAPSPAEGEESPDSPSKPGKPEDVSDDALLAALDQLKADVPLNKIERFREVLAENRQLKGSNERYQQLDSTLTDIGNDARKMGLSNEALAQLFSWPRLLAKDPQAAVEQIRVFAQQWQEKVGQVLPADLRAKVDDGTLDEDTAKEVAQLRATNALDKTRTAAEQQDRERETTDRRSGEIRDSVNAYQAELKKSDPDYTPEKHALVVDALTALVTKHGVPTTVVDARAMAKDAYDSVTKRLAAFKPQPRAIANPTVGRRLNKPAESQPKSMREAIENSLGL